jgi:signal transduction histidine kinase
MPRDSQILATNLKEFFNTVHCLTNLSIGLKINDNIITNDEYGSDFCRSVNDLAPEICSQEFKDNRSIHMCEAGFWCASIPVLIDKDTMGYISIGHKPIIGKEEETNSQLSRFCKKIKLGNEDNILIKDYFHQEDKISEDTLISTINRCFPLIEKKIRNEIRREDQIRRENALYSSLAHSFLTPIQAIVAMTENLSLKLKNSRIIYSELVNDCWNILEELTKLSYASENLRDWMVEEKYYYKLDLKQNVPIYNILINAVNLFKKEASIRGIKIKGPVPISMPFPYLKVSEPHLSKVFYNLLSNAIKYSFEGRASQERYVDITCKPVHMANKEYYCIEIANYGVGILPDEIEKVFEFGYRGKLSRDRNRFGSGLGLATVKRIVEQHGGSVAIESTPIDISYDGSRLNPYKTSVRVYLPLT